jgi:hypothetical protein
VLGKWGAGVIVLLWILGVTLAACFSRGLTSPAL